MCKSLCLFITSIFSLSLNAATQLQVKGSDTEVNVVQILAEKHMVKAKDVTISVTGGGSGTGIAALFNKTADLANSSRPMKNDEISKAKQSGINPERIIFATDALSVIVNKDNPLKEITIEQISKIFSGEVKNWREVGGKDEPISLYGRQSNSGTFTFFRDAVVKADYSPEMKSMNGNSQITEAVMHDKGGVGYVGVAYTQNSKTKKAVTGIKVLAVGPKGKAVSPLEEKNIITGKYPISRPLYQYFVVLSPQLSDFLKFELGPEGRKLILSEGFYEIKKEWKAENDKVLKKIDKN